MDGKKTYQLVINGITENIDAVESLNKQLDALDKRINALSNTSINVKTNGGGASSSLSQAAALEKEINSLKNEGIKLDAKIEASQTETYKRVQATKDVLKATLDDQKQIAAQERLQANTYTNTLNGLKQKLADIKTAMQGTEIGSDLFDRYVKEANDLNDKLKEIEKAYGQFGRNVGNYASAAEGFNKIKVAVGGVIREYDNYRLAVKELTQERFRLSQTLGQESKEYKDIDTALRKLISDYQDLNKSSKFMDTMLDSMQAFSNLAGIGMGITQLFGLDDSKLDESIRKMGSLFLIIQNIESLNKLYKSGDMPFANFFNKMGDSIENFADKLGAKLFDIKAKVFNTTHEIMDEVNDELFDGFTKNFDKITDYIKSWDNDEVKDLFNDMIDAEGLDDELKNVAKSINDAIDSGKNLSDVFKGLTEDQQGWVYATLRANEKVAQSYKYIGKTVKVLGNIIKAAATMGAALIASELLSVFFDWIKSLDTSKAKLKELNQELKAVNQTLQTQRDLLSAKYLKEKITDEEYLKGTYEAQNAALVKQLELVKQLGEANNRKESTDIFGLESSPFASSKNLEFTGSMLQSPRELSNGYIATLSVTVESIGEVEKAWKNCQKAIANGQDYLSENGQGVVDSFNSLFTTVSDTEEIMRGLGNVRLSQLVGAFDEIAKKYKEGKIDAEDYAAELGRLVDQMNTNEVLNSVIANLDEYIPDEKVRENVQNIIDEIKRLDDAFNMTSPQQVHFWEQVRIEGMKDGLKKSIAMIDENERWEIVQYGKTEKQIKLIQEKYQRQREKARKSHYDKTSKDAKDFANRLAELEEELQLLRLNNLKAGLDKQLKLIEFNRAKELRMTKDKLKELGVYNEKWKDFEYEINVKYDKLIVDEKRKWANETLKIYQDLSNNIAQVNRGTFEKEGDTAVRNVEVRTQVQEEQIGTEALGLGLPETARDVNAWEEYYTKVFEVRKQAIERQTKIEQERIEKEYDYSKQEEALRHERFLADDSELQRSLDEGKITREQYDKLIEDENDAHYARMKAIDVEYATSVEEITRNELNDVEQEYLEAFDEILNVTAEGKDKVDEIIGRSPKVDDTWGIVLLSQTRRTYKQALEYYDNYKKALKAKQAELLKARESGTISSVEAANRQKALDAEVKAVDEAAQEVKQKQSELIADFMGSVNQYAQQVGQTASSILSSLSDITANQFEAELDAQERFIQKYQENLDKQKDATQQYADAVSEIEGNLKEARGDARQYLLDNLNVQVAAQRASLAQEKKIEKEKEKAEERKKKLEHDQAVAKKRMDLAQAVINTSMAISYAAVNKWPVPAIPMMALAAAAGAAQFAAIQSQEIPSYGEGGQLSGGIAVGNRHRDGGIKVLGGRAEIEGGEYVTNRISTSYNTEVLDFINSKKRRINLADMVEFYSKGKIPANIRSASPTRVFADGGEIPVLRSDIDINDRLVTTMEQYANRPTVVSVQEIVNVNDNLNQVKVLSGLEPSTI